MKSLLEQITAELSDMQPADIVRVLSFLGFSASDMANGPVCIEHKGQEAIVPKIVVDATANRPPEIFKE